MVIRDFFEGAEKKVEIFGLGINFRSLPREHPTNFIRYVFKKQFVLPH